MSASLGVAIGLVAVGVLWRKYQFYVTTRWPPDVPLPRVSLLDVMAPVVNTDTKKLVVDAMCEGGFLIVRCPMLGNTAKGLTQSVLRCLQSTPREVKSTWRHPEYSNPKRDPGFGWAGTYAKETLHYRQGPWLPIGPDHLEPTLCSLYSDFESLATRVYELLAEAYPDLLDGAKTAEDCLRKYGALGPDEGPWTQSKLQAFYYYNEDSVADRPNIGEHVDRGFLSLEPYTGVPSLEVFHLGRRMWLPVEHHMSHGDSIIFAAETTQRLSRGHIPGVIHRVAKASYPRVSLVYKVRHREGADDAVANELHFAAYESTSPAQGGLVDPSTRVSNS